MNRVYFTLTTVLLASLGASAGFAQETGAGNNIVKIESIHWGNPRPGEILAARMHAHADQMRSFGYGAAKYGEFLIHREKAIEMRLDNQLKSVVNFFEAKKLKKAYRDELRVDRQEQQILSNSKRWQNIKSLPELANKTSGAAHNFLLNRLSNTVLAFQFAQEKGKLTDEMMTYMRLEPELYDDLWLKQGETRFRATNGGALDVSWWPFVLRDPQFDDSRNEFIVVRNEIAGGSDDEIDFDELDRLSVAHEELATELNSAFQDAKSQAMTFDERTEWRRGFKYLDGLYLEMRKLKQSGKRNMLDGQMRFEPSSADGNFMSFLRFMTRNGLEFAPASKDPQSISAYNTVFIFMRDLYVLADEDDPAVSPKKIKTLND